MSRLSLGFGVGIIILCLGYILSGCGAGPQIKTAVPKKGAYALSFPSNNDSAFVSASKTANLTNSNITVEAWVKVSSGEGGTIFSRGETNSSGVMLVISGSGAASFTVNSDSVSSTTPVNNSIWHHVAGVFVSTVHPGVSHPSTVTCTTNAISGMHMDIYVDGVLENCKAVSAYPTNIDCTACNNSIGHDTVEDYFKGSIDEVRLWKEARTPSQLATYRSTEITPENWFSANPSGALVGYWSFNEGSGSSTADGSGYGGSGSWSGGGGWTTGYPF